MKHRIGLGFAWLLFLLQSLQAQEPAVSAGKIIRYNNFPSSIIPSREIDVWLPPGYTETHRYPVLYLHDGQMLFDSSTTWNHQEWGVDETMGNLLAANRIRNCIVVGVWNIPERRHREYFPQKAFELLSGAEKKILSDDARNANSKPLLGDGPISDNYLKFLTIELKPFIDSTFSTKKDRKNTFVAGSSMGGLISLYAICEYPDVFGGAACLSTHWAGIFRLDNNPLPQALMQYLREHLPSPKNHLIYFDHGTATLDALYPSLQKQADAIMKEKGFKSGHWITRVFEGEDHSERAWKKRLDIPLLFLLKK